MLPASTKGGGQCFAFPDVCKVPAPPAPFVPAPFPNIAMSPQATGCSTKVKIDGQPAIMKGTKIPMSSGDEPGTLGGMVSAVFKNSLEYKMGSSKVKVEGKELCQLTSMTAQNGSNPNIPPGNHVAPSQVKVLCAK